MTVIHVDEDRLVAYALNELPAGERSGVDAHVSDCPSCRRSLTALCEALDAVRKPERPAAPARVLVDLVEAQAAGRNRGFFSRIGFGRMVPVTAIVVALFVTGFWAGRQSVAVPGVETREQGSSELSKPLPDPPTFAFHAAAPLEAALGSPWSEPVEIRRDSL